VISGGAAGIAVALQFVHTPVRVVLLESGGLTEVRVCHGLYQVVYGSPPRVAIDPQRPWYFGGPSHELKPSLAWRAKVGEICSSGNFCF